MLVLVNPVANARREKILQQLLQTLTASNVGYQYLETFANVEQTAAALAALPANFNQVVVLGFDGALVQKLGTRKFIWPKLSYVLAALQSLFSYRAQSFELQATNQKLLAIGQRPAFLFTLANSQYFGAGMHIAPHAKISDGKLAYCLIERCGNFTKLNVFRRVFAGTHGEHGKVHCGQLSAVSVCAQGLPVQADGEWVGETPMIFRTIPAAISIRKPSF
ncbi:diacylglycerol/lipid kinase family protein [Aliidiomarina sp.]|uniref:diacylglycerol/lipid kinase family protein n=1 Tax=Aliidiomarina sp. TaxID=1872439 RepID=UPI003A4DF10F